MIVVMDASGSASGQIGGIAKIDIARAALFFASDDSAFVTGAELCVDGGMAAGL